MKKKFSSWVLLVIAVICIWLGGTAGLKLLDMRQAYHLDLADPLEKAPPLVVFTTVALGGLRGMVADVLWMKASLLQDTGRYLEIAQLADWITKLQPQFATAWAFHGWNMAYNISYMFPDPEDRLRWINNGISLIRDEGLKYNPGDPNLYREIGWIYQHKIGGIYDTAHKYYKQKLARQISAIIDPSGFIDNQSLSPESKSALRKELGMDTAALVETDTIYGPLDWRLPEAHAIYWAHQGKQSSSERRDTYACDQMLFQNMSKTFKAGRLYFDATNRLYSTWPRFEMLEKTLKTYEQAIKEHDSNVFRQAEANFRSHSVFMFYLFGYDEKARLLFEELKEKYPSPDDPDYNSFIAFMLQALDKDMNRDDALMFINGFLSKAAILRKTGAHEKALENEKRAGEIYIAYTRKIEDAGLKSSLELPPFDLMKKLAEQYTLNSD